MHLIAISVFFTQMMLNFFFKNFLGFYLKITLIFFHLTYILAIFTYGTLQNIFISLKKCLLSLLLYSCEGLTDTSWMPVSNPLLLQAVYDECPST